MAPPELPRNVIYIISAIEGSIGDDKETVDYMLANNIETEEKEEEEITLNVLSTGRAGLRAVLRILKLKAPVTNSNKAWSGYTCKHKHTYNNRFYLTHS